MLLFLFFFFYYLIMMMMMMTTTTTTTLYTNAPSLIIYALEMNTYGLKKKTIYGWKDYLRIKKDFFAALKYSL